MVRCPCFYSKGKTYIHRRCPRHGWFASHHLDKIKAQRKESSKEKNNKINRRSPKKPVRFDDFNHDHAGSKASKLVKEIKATKNLDTSIELSEEKYDY